MRVCDKCGKKILNDSRYVVAQSCSKPNEKGEAPSHHWLMVKEVCMKCAVEIEQLFSKEG